MQYLFRVAQVENKEQIGIGAEKIIFEDTYNFAPLVPRINESIFIPNNWRHYNVIDISYVYPQDNGKFVIDIYVTQEDDI
jgi:hypothetical protein